MVRLFFVLVFSIYSPYTTSVFSQTAKFDLSIPEGVKVKHFGFESDGDFYYVVKNKNEKSSFSVVKVKMDEDFNSFTTDLNEYFRPYHSLTSDVLIGRNNKLDNLESSADVNLVHDDERVFRIAEEEFLPKKHETYITFVKGENFIALTRPRKFKKNSDQHMSYYRKNLLSNEVSRSNLSLKTVFKPFEIWNLQLKEVSNDGFELAVRLNYLKDEQENQRISKFTILKYDYEGHLISKHNLQSEVTSIQHFHDDANTSTNAYKRTTGEVSNGFSSGVGYIYTPHSEAYGKIELNRNEDDFYMFNALSSKKEKFGNGFLVNRYKEDGTLLWTKQQMLTDSKQSIYYDGSDVEQRLFQLKNSLFFITWSGRYKYCYVYQLDKKNGSVVEKTEFHNLKGYDLYGFGSVDNTYTNEFLSDFMIKDAFGDRLVLDATSVIAYIADENFKSYIDKISDNKNRIHIKTQIVDDTIIALVAENKSNEFKLLVFDK